MKRAIIITIGDELLIGQVIDTNSVWLAQKLNLLGIELKQRIAIADEKEEIINTLKKALEIVDLVIITGGLGPTKDDMTKDALSTYFDSHLIQNAEVLQHIESIYKKNNKVPLPQNYLQAEVPHNCKVLFNRFGTAPGMLFEQNDKLIISLPGVPYEMQAIMEDHGLSVINNQLGSKDIYHKTLIITRLGESLVADKIADIEDNLPLGIHLAYLPGLGILKLRITGDKRYKDDLILKIEQIAVEIKERLADYCIYEKDSSLEDILADVLIRKHLTLGLAESCTGGNIAHRITNIPGSSQYFKGSIVCYSNEIKKTILSVPQSILETVGAVSEETVRIMAESALEILDVDYALSVSGILGPAGATPEKAVGLVWMAIAHKNKTITKKFQFRYDRIRNKELAVNSALDWLRATILLGN